MINRGFKRENKKNIPDIHGAVKIYRISGAALTCSLITVTDKTTSSKLGRHQKKKDYAELSGFPDCREKESVRLV